MGSVDAVQRRTAGAVRWTVPCWTSEAQTRELAADQSAPPQARLAWARHLPMSDASAKVPFHVVFGSAPARCAWRRAHRERGVPRPPSRGRGIVVHAWFLPLKSLTSRAAQLAEDCRRHAFNVWNQTFPDGDAESLPFSSGPFPRVSFNRTT